MKNYFVFLVLIISVVTIKCNDIDEKTDSVSIHHHDCNSGPEDNHNLSSEHGLEVMPVVEPVEENHNTELPDIEVDHNFEFVETIDPVEQAPVKNRIEPKVQEIIIEAPLNVEIIEPEKYDEFEVNDPDNNNESMVPAAQPKPYQSYSNQHYPQHYSPNPNSPFWNTFHHPAPIPYYNQGAFPQQQLPKPIENENSYKKSNKELIKELVDKLLAKHLTKAAQHLSSDGYPLLEGRLNEMNRTTTTESAIESRGAESVTTVTPDAAASANEDHNTESAGATQNSAPNTATAETPEPKVNTVEARIDVSQPETNQSTTDIERQKLLLLQELDMLFNLKRRALRVYVSDVVLDQMSSGDILKLIFKLPSEDAETIIPNRLLTKLKSSRIFKDLPGSEYVEKQSAQNTPKESTLMADLGRYFNLKRLALKLYLPDEVLEKMSTEDILKFVLELPEKDAAKIIHPYVIQKLRHNPEVKQLLKSSPNDQQDQYYVVNQAKTYPKGMPGKATTKNTVYNWNGPKKAPNFSLTRETARNPKPNSPDLRMLMDSRRPLPRLP